MELSIDVGAGSLFVLVATEISWLKGAGHGSDSH
jgi:hypothetical protein